MDDNETRISAALERLFRTYPQSDRGDVLDLALERMERAKVYLEAVAPYDVRDIEAAVSSFLTGAAPGVNPSFLPPAPAVGSEVRRMMNLRLDSERREQLRAPALPPPEIEHTPESRAKVKALVDSAVANLQAASLDDPAERHRSAIRKANEYFDARRGFSVGDPEGAADAA